MTKDERKNALMSLKRTQNIFYYAALGQIGLGVLNTYFYSLGWHKYWLIIIAINIIFAISNILNYQKDQKIIWRLENESNSN